MFGFGKKKEKKVVEKPTKPIDQIADDLVGVSEWKESKVGYLTGISSAGKVVGSVSNNLGQSATRLGSLVKMLQTSESLPTLPEIEEDERYDGRERFKQAMALHGKTDGQIRTSISNTRRSAYLYGAVTVGAALYLGWRLLFSTEVNLHGTILHLVPLPVFSALTLRAAYYNWMFRNRTLEPISAFLNAKDKMPA